MNPPIKPTKVPANQPVVFYGSLQSLRARAGLDPELEYVEAFQCPTDRHLTNAITGYVGPDGRVFCQKSCYEETMIIEDIQ